MTRRHPAHTQIHKAVRAWFHEPFDDMGYRAERRSWGTYWSNGCVYTPGFPARHLARFLDAVRSYYPERDGVDICLDSRAADQALGPALRAAGYTPGETDVFLAHVGALPAVRHVPALYIEPVDATNVDVFARVRLQAFENTEDVADAGRLDQEIERRRMELSGTGMGLLAYLADEPAAVVWWFDEWPDRWVNYLGTRLPFRRKGIARQLLRYCVADAYEQAYRSVVLNVNTNYTPALRLYHRLGFHDEVYWRRCYRIDV